MEIIKLKWEYKSEYCPSIDKMNELGQEGWELVRIHGNVPQNYVCLFKRPIFNKE